MKWQINLFFKPFEIMRIMFYFWLHVMSSRSKKDCRNAFPKSNRKFFLARICQSPSLCRLKKWVTRGKKIIDKSQGHNFEISRAFVFKDGRKLREISKHYKDGGLESCSSIFCPSINYFRMWVDLNFWTQQDFEWQKCIRNRFTVCNKTLFWAF